VLDRPFSVARKETAARSNGRTAIDKWWCVGGMNQTTPGALAHQQTNLAVMKHVRHQIAAGTGHLVNDHDFRSPNPCGRTGEGITIAGDVIEIAIKVALQDVDNIIRGRTAAIEPLVDDCAFLILLREVVPIEALIARLTGVWQIDVGKLAIRKSFNQTPIRFNPRPGAEALFVSD